MLFRSYQDRIDKINNSNALTDKLLVQYIEKDNLIILTYPPDSHPTGNIMLYRPSDATLDIEYKVVSVGQIQKLNTKSLERGYWKIKIEWSSEGIEYYDEKTIVI